MKKTISLILLAAIFATSNAFAFDNCKDVYEGKFLRRESRRAKTSAIAVWVAAVAVSPIVTPLGAAAFGSAAVILLGSGEGMHWANHKRLLLPHEVKELMLMDQAINPDKPLHLKKQKPNERIFRRTVGYDITFSAETKKDLMEKFVMHLKNKARRQGAGAAQVDDITTESVSATIAKLNNAGKALCTHENGSERALMMFKFENVILWDMEESGKEATSELF